MIGEQRADVVNYRCAACGVTETGTRHRLDRYWITVRAASRAADRKPARYCGEGCVGEAGDRRRLTSQK